MSFSEAGSTSPVWPPRWTRAFIVTADPERSSPMPTSPLGRTNQGITVFFTGLSGAGKSTIAGALSQRFAELGLPVILLDGDEVRKQLSPDLGFSKEHRDIHIRRVGAMAAQITKGGGIAICASIAPYAAVREEVRRLIESVGTFVLVYVSTPLDVCEQRDVKGLYA